MKIQLNEEDCPMQVVLEVGLEIFWLFKKNLLYPAEFSPNLYNFTKIFLNSSI